MNLIQHPTRSAYCVLTSECEVQGIKLPLGYILDGCSIPPWLRGVMGTPFDRRYRRAAGLHDYLYETHKASKALADFMFARQLRLDGVDSFQADLMYEGVRLFGDERYDTPSTWPKFVDPATVRLWALTCPALV